MTIPSVVGTSIQLGQSSDPSKNFILVSPEDGSLIIKRGDDNVVATCDDTGKWTFVGVAQTWQDKLSVRAIDNTVYTNDTPQKIEVVVYAMSSTTAALSLYCNVAGQNIGIWSAHSAGSGYRVTATFSVPAGATYSVLGAATAGTLTKELWKELR